MKLSIAICTYNRVDLLEYAIRSVVNQLDNKDVELLIIDNNSTDDTEILSSRYVNDANVLYFKEESLGLSYARNRAMHESRGIYIAYIDDDAELGDTWVDEALAIIQQYAPDIYGGPYFPLYKSEKPKWYNYDYEIINIEKSGWLTDDNGDGIIGGCNMVFKTSYLISLGGFDPEFGMKGDKLYYGEESAIIDNAIKQNGKVYYSCNLCVHHFVPPFKMTLPYFYERYYQLGVTKYWMEQKDHRVDHFSSHKDALFYLVNELDKMNESYHQIILKIKKNDIQGEFENEIVKNIIQQHIYVLGYLNEKAKHIVPKRNSFWGKVYRMNLETVVVFLGKRFFLRK
ncbi:MAG: glycosyltransferase family A protein [Bacteroidota bacterium]